MGIDQLCQRSQLAAQGQIGLTHQRCRGTQAQVRLHFGHCQLDGAVAHDLEYQRTIELDVGLHEHTSRRHFAKQGTDGLGVGAGILVAGTALQDFLPGVSQANNGATHGQAVKNEFMQFRHANRFR
ncbi:hypothetical protein SDC9_125835 [bioreactor metagenome]|uniref:Uncharacterized protein n=1 Tax=bioreactor metagenome TaxID=1076179 RepID=A0A645CP21_9ZZZZ